MSFATLGLSDKLLRAIAEQGYETPTPIQSEAIPVILQGQDILASAQTGTGKTAGFTLPMLHMLNELGQNRGRQVRALILTPTRELAAQVQESVKIYGKYMPLRTAAVYGGVRMEPQVAKLRRGVDILVATPGRLLDHLRQGTVDLSAVDMLVLDEADRMLDMGFIHDIRTVIDSVPPERQVLLFSATFSQQIKKLADDLLKSPRVIEVARTNAASANVTQVIYPVDRHRKRELLSHIIGSRNWQRVLVFTRTKHGANRLADQLKSDGLRADAIHGGKSQGARNRALTAFKRGSLSVLVGTDIAARGLDIDDLPHVVNFDLPNVPEDYIHRIGRTGRAGSEGDAVSLVCVDERYLLKNIERLLKRDIPQEVIPGYEPDLTIAPQPIPGAKRPPKQRRRERPYQSRSSKPRNTERASQDGRRSRSNSNGRSTPAPVIRKRSNVSTSGDSRRRA